MGACVDSLVINGVEYVKKQPMPTGNIKIAILQRGWVFVGRFYQDGSNCRLENCMNIRVWGSTKGLGEIASTGPTPKTVLDYVPVCRFHELTIIALLDCMEEKWASKLL